MRTHVRLLTGALVAGCLTAASHALLRAQALPDRELVRALDVARGSDHELARFHAQYLIAGSGSVRSVEIVTPFRRAVTLARLRVATTGRMPGLEELRAAAEQRGNSALVRAVIVLDPRHGYLSPPAFSIELRCGTGRTHATDIERQALGPGGTLVPAPAVGGAVMMTAVQVDAWFQSAAVQAAAQRIVVADPDGTPLLVRDLPVHLR